MSLLHRIEADRDRQDQDDDCAADGIAGQNGNDASDKQNERKRLEQAPKRGAQGTDGLGRRIAVGAIAVKPLARLGRGEPVHRTAELHAGLLR